MHFVYSKIQCAENRNKWEKGGEVLGKPCISHFHFHSVTGYYPWSWEFTDSLKNVYQLARSILGSADCTSQLLWISWIRNSPVKGVVILWPTLSSGSCMAPSYCHHSCLLWQEHHKWLPVWVRSSQAQGCCVSGAMSLHLFSWLGTLPLFFFFPHSLINVKGSERGPLHGPLHFKK